MGSGNRGVEGINHKKKLEEGIKMVLQRWNGLQMAVQNQWGGSDSDQKFNHLASDLFSSLSKSTGKASSLLHLSPIYLLPFPDNLHSLCCMHLYHHLP